MIITEKQLRLYAGAIAGNADFSMREHIGDILYALAGGNLLVLSDDRFPLKCGAPSVGDGWEVLIRILARAVDEEWAHGHQPKVEQIKEKFGLIRIYMDDATDRLDRVITQLEAWSARICEECGDPGKVRTGTYWLKTRCDTHQKAYEEARVAEENAQNLHKTSTQERGSGFSPSSITSTDTPNG